MAALYERVVRALKAEAATANLVLSDDDARRLAASALRVMRLELVSSMRLPRQPSGSAAAAPESAALHLTRRQEEILSLLVDGKSSAEIAKELALAPGTVKVHTAAIYKALNVRNRVGAVLEGAKLLGKPVDQQGLGSRSVSSPSGGSSDSLSE